MLNFDNLARRFLDGANDPQVRMGIVTEIRDNIEVVHSPEYGSFLTYMFPVFYNVLRQGAAQFNDGLEQKIRNMILEILSRLPTTELLKQYVANLLKLAMYLLEVENEENAVICLRIIIDLHKSYRPSLMADVQAFLDIVLKIYNELPKTVQTAFKEKPPTPTTSGTPTPGSSGGTPGASTQIVSAISETSKPTTLIASTSSFKVLTECPIIVVLLFQLYPNFAPQNVPRFMPLIVQALSLPPPPNARNTHHAAYVDFIAAQVKTLSFLAYLLRGNAEHVKQYLDILPKCVIQLLTNCPNESAATRKELLIATRHILATDFRSAFVPHIDPLLDEKVWIGSGRTSYESLRPLAYSTLADLVHHIRAELNLNQLARVVFLYTKNLHDSSLPFSIMTMSVKLLLHLVEFIPRKSDPSEPGKARYLLVRVLDSFVNKFISLKRHIPKLASPPTPTDPETPTTEANWADTVKDCRTLLKTLVLGLKNIVWGITNCGPSYQRAVGVPGSQGAQPSKMNVEESLIFVRLLKNGLKCFAVFSCGPTPAPQEEKETLEHFASVYTMVAPHIFMDVYSMLMPYLFECTLENQAMLAIPQHFLSNPMASKAFAEILLNFLMDRIKNLAGTDKNTATVLLRLFKLVFSSIPLFPENESVLQPHLATIVTSAMKYASEVKESVNYFALLRSLFRSIGGGKFDLFMKEFLPLLPGLLEGLNKLQNSSHSATMKELFVELSLTVPVRLSLFLPCLPLLIKPLVLALESNSDLATQGLRTLDMMVDNITHEYLETLIAEVKTDLLKAVWRHLRPPPYPNGHVAIRVLGKLSGRCRVPVVLSNPLPSEENTYDGFNITINFEPNIATTISMGKIINSLKKTLIQSTDAVQQKNAFQFIRGCLILLLNASKIDTPRVLAIIANTDTAPALPPLTSAIHVSPREKIMCDVGMCKILLECLIIAASNEKLRPETTKFYEQICKHFAILFSMHNEVLNRTVMYNIIDPTVLIDTFMHVITMENRNFTKTALDGIEVLIDSLQILRGTKDQPHPLFNHLALQLSHACYQKPWHVKGGACAGISHLCSKLPPQWVRTHEVLFVKALLFLLKDLPPEISVGTVEEASQTLALVIKVCNSHTESAQTEESTKVFTDVVQALASELFTPHPTVRKNVQSSLEQLAELTGHEVTELLLESRTALLIPVFNKTLRAQPTYVQIGHIEALTYCLGLRPPLLEFSPELLKHLKEALTIAETDDTLLPQAKLPSYKSHIQSINLRVVAIELMSAAMACPEFQSSENQELRNQIIGMFFKALTFRAKEVVAVAKTGLAQVITQHKLAKELLQSSLRPVLLNLQNHSKLTVSLLQGLAKLLELLTNCFNVTLGEKLLELLQKWAHEPAKREETKVACAIIEIFHLLPSQAVKFLEQLVNMAVSLENQLPREINSPYRAPLTKFLNKYPTRAVDLFLGKLSQPAFSKMFRFVIRSELAGPLRDELAKNSAKLIAVTFQKTEQQPPAAAPTPAQPTGLSPQPPGSPPPLPPAPVTPAMQAPSELQFQGLLLVRTLVKFIPDWLGQNPTVLEYLMEIWKSPARVQRLQTDQVLPQHYLRESKIIIKCFLNYCRAHKDEIDVLFQMLSIFIVRTTMDFSFLRDFYTQEIAEGYTPEQKKAILSRFLQFFRDKEVSQDHKVQAFQILITPLLTSVFQKKEESQILDPPMISSIVSEILESEQQQGYEEALNIELLQLATLLVRNMTAELVDHRKDLIKFAWGHLKSEDTTSKQCAYVLVCRFIEAYETPPKIILQVYVALLRSFQLEARSLVRQALDILTPALKRRLGPADARYPPWIKWTKKIIVEEGHALPQLIHILLLLVRHPQLFYPCRAQFVPPMVNSLARIGLVSNTSFENKKLAVDLAELVIKWENQRIKDTATPMAIDSTPAASQEAATPSTSEVASPAQTPHTPSASGSTSTQIDEEYKPPAGIMELVVHFLVRMASTASDSREVSGLPERSLELLKQALIVWPDVFVKFNYFEKLLAPVTEQPAIVCTGLAILNVILDYQLHNFVLPNITQLKQAIIPSLNSDNPKIIAPLCILLKKIMKAFPHSDPAPEMAGFYGTIKDHLENSLRGYEKGQYLSILSVLKTISEESPEYLDKFLSDLVKLVGKLAKDHTTPSRETAETADATAAANAQPAAGGAANAHAPAQPGAPQIAGRGATPAAQAAKAKPKDTAGSALVRAINLIAIRVNQLGNDRKSFIASLLLLIEKSQDVELLTEITKMIGQWITNNNGNNNNAFVFAGKEKITFLIKMTRFDQIPSTELQGLFLDLVYHVFSDPSASREQGQLEAGFMMGLRSKDPTVRSNFFDLFHKSIGSGLNQRLQYIFAQQNWETLGSTYWMRVALDLILASAVQTPLVYEGSMKLVPIPSVLEQDHANGKFMETDAVPEATQFLNTHSEFLESAIQANTAEFVMPLRELFAQDSHLVHMFWMQLFPAIWGKLSKDEQNKLTKPFVQLLAKDYHTKQQGMDPNVVQTLLDGITQCATPMRVPVDVLKYLSKPSNGWHCTHAGLRLIEPLLGDKPPAAEETVWDAVSELYQQLNEQDLVYGLWRRRATAEETKTGLVLEQHDFWQSAQEVYYAVMSKGLGGSVRTSKQESDLWEERWIACAKRLHQWDVLVDFARSQNNIDLLAECSIKVPDWNLLRETITKLPAQDSHIIKLYQGYLAVTDSIAEVDALSVQGMHIALKKWATYPDVSFPAHVPLLQYFQQILELQESAQIVKELSSVARHQSVPDLKSALNIWRERLPNRWEDVTAWNDVMTWRQHVFQLINNAFKSLAELNPSLAYIGHHETAWTINKFSHVARKHQLVEVCLNSLSKIYTLPNIEIQDAFVKLREQIKCYFQLSTHYRTGLDIINSTNLDYFDANQKAEFFQLKGEFHHRMGNKDEANLALSTCLSLSENFAKGWVCWAYFCDHQFGEMDPKDPARISYAENAVNCYMQAVRTHTVHCNKYLSRVLWLVMYCTNMEGNDAVFQAVEKGVAVLPSWIWIMWIPQLLASLRRHEFQNIAISILQKIASTFPQALHYPLRAFIAEIDLLLQYQTHKNRNAASSGNPETPNGNGPMNDIVMMDMNYSENTMESLQMCVNRARELLHHLHNAHPVLIGPIELMMNGIATCSKTDPIHALYSSLRSIVHECFKVQSNETPPNVFDMLQSMFMYFSTSAHPTLDPLRPSFEKELLSNEIRGASFLEVIERIKNWAARLLPKAEMLAPKNLHLENISAYLLDFHTNNTVNTSIEMPGQYTGEKEPSPEQHVLIERFSPEVTHTQENGMWTRVITIMGSNGRSYPFMMHIHNAAAQQTHRSNQLLRLFNSILVRHRETSKRGINFVNIPCIFAVSPKVWLVHQPATRDFESLEDIKIAECYHDPVGIDPDAAIMYHKQRIIDAATGVNKATKLQIYRDITKQHSPDNILLKHMQRKLSNYAQLFEIRKYMASQLALHSLVGYILGCIPKSPENLRFSKSTGAMLPWNIALSHQPSQFNLESLPFRLTPNLRAFLGPNIVEGTFIPSMVAASMCFAEAKEQVHNFLNLHAYNNHIMTWWNENKSQEPTLSLVLEQVGHMMNRVNALTPPIQPDKKLYVVPIYKKVSELVTAATNPQNLAQMDAVWQPWL
eukprot:Phypoly_transcript_00015.p1 GENE.Phypoly_transcript_00015~~Phypoly_transcript_00015.p1  ORF type:complete len:3639 (+),score=586.09 Phypoly_transcript_00015:159-11075(+)